MYVLVLRHHCRLRVRLGSSLAAGTNMTALLTEFATAEVATKVFVILATRSLFGILTVICHYYLSLLFVITICHYYLSLLFVITICQYNF